MNDEKVAVSLDDAFRIASESVKTASDNLERYTASSGAHDADRVIRLISTVAAAQRHVSEAYFELLRSREATPPEPDRV